MSTTDLTSVRSGRVSEDTSVTVRVHVGVHYVNICFGYGMEGISKRRRLGLVMFSNDSSPILHIVFYKAAL